MMENKLVVSGENGSKYTINYIDTFTVDEYPGKEYIAYTFTEPTDNEDVKTYISILKETESDYSLLGISDKNEWEVVLNTFNELIEN